METKNAKVRRLVSQGDYKEALQICKDWNYADNNDREKLRRGYECLVHPRFYKELGYDTELAYEEAIEVLNKVYKIKATTDSK